MTSVSLAGSPPEVGARESERGVRLPLTQQLQACEFAASNPVPVQLLRKYIAYAQTYVVPVLSAEAKEVCRPTTSDFLSDPDCGPTPHQIPVTLPTLISHQQGSWLSMGLQLEQSL